ncbi:hypothetical protein [Corynebacterium glyciniphilum]|uniref:hypothetical protein n=1 Tax=Corynebacterium glyciniphilum TaxID=1404244 RepID=UPI00264EDBFE|nr:hypothetical protein [Corynebacterium glyciniphilum]MDN6706372.1 hypothetical protein [Corynebacterium glyciniphilum]
MIRNGMTWQSPSGEILEFAVDRHPSTGLWVTEAEGFVSEVETETEISADGVGEDRTGYSIPAFTGELTVLIAPRDAGRMVTVADAWGEFSRAFNQLRYGRLTIPQYDGQILSTPMRLAAPIAPPEFHPRSQKDYIEAVVELRSDAGVWTGRTEPGVTTEEGALRLLNAGDLPAFVDVEFTHGTVSINGADPVTLPTVDETRRLVTNPGQGYKITDPATGRADVDAWSSMRGRPVPGRVEPGEMVLVENTGDVSVSLTPLFTTPWR